jgi:hypothetical protein
VDGRASTLTRWDKTTKKKEISLHIFFYSSKWNIQSSFSSPSPSIVKPIYICTHGHQQRSIMYVLSMLIGIWERLLHNVRSCALISLALISLALISLALISLAAHFCMPGSFIYARKSMRRLRILRWLLLIIYNKQKQAMAKI